jgi:beta-lactamase regulating signal transducer with metallopeptidase domain
VNFPDPEFWYRLFLTVGVEVCWVCAIAWLARRAATRVVWQRAISRLAVVCLLFAAGSELTGFGRATAGMLLRGRQAAGVNQTTITQLPITAAAIPAFRAPIAGSATNKPAAWWPAWLWVVGTLLVLARIATAQGLLTVLRLRRNRILDSPLAERVLRVARSVGLRRNVYLFWMPRAISPMAFGILRPSVGLPPDFGTRFSDAEQSAILAHEVAHLAAMDPLWFGVADFASALLWWHPLVWWLRRSLHVSAELAADEATNLVPDGPASLANCLVTLGKEMSAAGGSGWAGINGGFRSNLGQRVERLLEISGGLKQPVSGYVGRTARVAAAIISVPTMVLLFGAFQSAEGQRENGLRESWRNSPGGLLVSAVFDDTDGQEDDISPQIREAKLEYEKGNLDEAERICVEILKDQPSNRAAPCYLDLIKEARYAARDRGEIRPIPSATTQRQAIRSKLESIELPEMRCDQLLTEVLRRLASETQERDPEGKGVRFLINPATGPFTNRPSPKSSHGNSSLGSAPVGTEQPIADMGTVHVTIEPSLRNVRLIDVLNQIVFEADQPIQYTVEDYGVVFAPKGPPQTLYSKAFQWDGKLIVANLYSLNGRTNATTAGATAGSGFRIVHPFSTNQTAQLDTMFRDYLMATGVDLTRGGEVGVLR